MSFGGLVHHLVHGQGDEVAKHDVNHGTKTGHRSAHGDAGESSFRNRSIDNPFGAELFDQSGENFEGRTGLSDVFADDADTRVAAHLFSERFANGLRKGKFALRHRRASPLRRRSDMAPRWRTSPRLP